MCPRTSWGCAGMPAGSFKNRKVREVGSHLSSGIQPLLDVEVLVKETSKPKASLLIRPGMESVKSSSFCPFAPFPSGDTRVQSWGEVPAPLNFSPIPHTFIHGCPTPVSPQGFGWAKGSQFTGSLSHFGAGFSVQGLTDKGSSFLKLLETHTRVNAQARQHVHQVLRGQVS